MTPTPDAVSFVPERFQPPDGSAGDGFRLVPLGPEHNEHDYEAWTSSVDHIRRTPGFEDHGWPHPMSLPDNRRDLEQHATDFRERTGFTYTVLAADRDEVIGCVYIYPGPAPRTAAVRSWVSVGHAELDRPLHQHVTRWLAQDWPFDRIDYAPRPGP